MKVSQTVALIERGVLVVIIGLTVVAVLLVFAGEPPERAEAQAKGDGRSEDPPSARRRPWPQRPGGALSTFARPSTR